MGQFQDHTVVVTGNGGGVHGACVSAFLDKGARVIVTDQAAAGALPEQTRAHPACHVAPLAAPVSVAGFEDVRRRFGPAHVLVNFTALQGQGDLGALAADRWRRICAENIDGVLFAAQGVARAEGCAIVNVVSVAGGLAVGNLPSLAPVGHAVIGMTRELAIGLGPSGSRVNAVLAGLIREETEEEAPNDAFLLRRAGRPAEVASAVIFLASEAASFVTGVTLPVDGGFLAGKGW